MGREEVVAICHSARVIIEGTATSIDFSLPTHRVNMIAPASVCRVVRLENAWDNPEYYPRRERPHMRPHHDDIQGLDQPRRWRVEFLGASK